MQMCPEYENSHFSQIFFQHEYLTYCSIYLLRNLYVYSLDVSGGKSVSKLLIKVLVFVLLFIEDGN